VSKTIKKAAVYARVSVKHQNRKDLSIEAQAELCRAYLLKKGVASEVLLFSDLGFSGRCFERPAFIRMKGLIEQGLISCVAVKDLSRLGRDYRRVGELAECFFPLHGVRLLSVTEGYDSAEPAGNPAAAGLYHLLNEWYAKDIGRKVALVKGEKKRAGNYLGSIAPYGFQIVRKGGIRVLEPDESYPVLTAIISMHEQGNSSEEIVRWLWQQNINPPAVYRKSGRVKAQGEKAKRWEGGTIRNLLKKQGRFPCHSQSVK